jgi:hypothetical protein
METEYYRKNPVASESIIDILAKLDFDALDHDKTSGPSLKVQACLLLLHYMLNTATAEELIYIRASLYKYGIMDFDNEELAKKINEIANANKLKDKKIAELEAKVSKLEMESCEPRDKLFIVPSRNTYNLEVEIGKVKRAKPKLFRVK